MVLVLVSGVAFAATVDSAATQLTTSVTGVAGVKLSQGATNPINSVATFASATSTPEVAFTAAALTVSNLYFNLRTNKTPTYNIDLSGYALLDASVGTKIGYVVTPLLGDGSAIGPLTVANTVVSGTPATARLVTFAGSTSAGMRVLSQNFKIEVNTVDYAAATEGSYAATLTINLVVD